MTSVMELTTGETNKWGRKTEKRKTVNDHGKRWCEKRENRYLTIWEVTENFTEGKKKSLEWIGMVRGSDGMQQERGNEWGLLMEREREGSNSIYPERERERERWNWGSHAGGLFIWPTDWSGNLGTYWWVKGGDGDGEDTEKGCHEHFLDENPNCITKSHLKHGQ